MPNLQVPHYVLRSSRTKVPSLHRHYPASPPPQGARPVPHGHPVGHPCPRLGVSRVAYAFLVYMLSPLPRRSGWPYSFAHSPQPYQPSPKGLSGRPAHRPFRDLLSVHFVAACTLALPPIRDTHSEGFSYFVTSIAAPAASGWSGCRVGLAPTGKRRLVTAHTQSTHPRAQRALRALSIVATAAGHG